MRDHPANHDGAVRVSSIMLGIAGSAAVHAAAVAVLFVTLGGPSIDDSQVEALVARGQPIQVRLVETEVEDEMPLPDPEPVESPIEPESPEIPEPAAPAPAESEASPIRMATNWCAETMDKVSESTARVMTKTVERAIAIEHVVSRLIARVPEIQEPPPVAPSSVSMGPPSPSTTPVPTQTASTPPTESTSPPEAKSPPRSAPKPVGVSNGVEVVSVPEPLYPAQSIRLGQEGTVEVEVSVLPDGTVADARITTSSGHRLLDRAALNAAKRGRYAPAKENGRAVAATILVPFEFHLHG